MLAITRHLVLFIVLLSGWSGVVSALEPRISPEPPAIPSGNQYQTFQPPTEALKGQEPPALPDENPAGVITLDRALALGLMQNPELASFSWEVRAAAARAIQAGLPANPEVEASVENFGGKNELEDFDGAETTIQISQTIELGGKRAKRRQAAELEKELARWDYESRRLDVFAETSRSFWDVIAAQEQCAIAGEIAAMADVAFNLAAERVKAGKVAPIEEIQSKVAAATSRIEFEQAKRTLETARKTLAATWGSARPEFEKAEAGMDILEPPPSFDHLVTAVSGNPDIARWDTEIENLRARVRLAEAGRIPDLTLGAGPRYYNESEDTAFVMNMSFPVPILNRHQGEVQEARVNLAKARESRKAAALKTQSDLEQAHQDLSSSYVTADALIRTVIPAAETAFEAALEGYREGKFGYLAVLETQRTLFEVKHQYITAVVNYHKSKTGLERLIGRDITKSL